VTAFTFGFDSAVAAATDALDRLHTTAASHERIMVLEVMGRHAGWIALHAGIAGGGDVILLPEIPWSFENVCGKILQREAEGKRFTLVVVAEGAHLPERGVVHGGPDGARQQVRLGGVGEAVAQELSRRLHRDVRTVVLGHLQRGGGPTPFDRVSAAQTAASSASATCCPDTKPPTGSGLAAAASPRGRGPMALSNSRRLSSWTVWPISCPRRGSTGIGITGCLHRTTSSGGP